jgi:hypothetical protein
MRSLKEVSKIIRLDANKIYFLVCNELKEAQTKLKS